LDLLFADMCESDREWAAWGGYCGCKYRTLCGSAKRKWKDCAGRSVNDWPGQIAGSLTPVCHRAARLAVRFTRAKTTGSTSKRQAPSRTRAWGMWKRRERGWRN